MFASLFLFGSLPLPLTHHTQVRVRTAAAGCVVSGSRIVILNNNNWFFSSISKDAVIYMLQGSFVMHVSGGKFTWHDHHHDYTAHVLLLLLFAVPSIISHYIASSLFWSLFWSFHSFIYIYFYYSDCANRGFVASADENMNLDMPMPQNVSHKLSSSSSRLVPRCVCGVAVSTLQLVHHGERKLVAFNQLDFLSANAKYLLT